MKKNPLPDLTAAFPVMPEDCRRALCDAARSVKEECTVTRRLPTRLLIAAMLMLLMTTTTLAIAEGWNVLRFLGLETDDSSEALRQTVSATTSAGPVTTTIDSAITDGKFIAMDWTVTNTAPEVPVYLFMKDFRAGGTVLFYDELPDFHQRWLPAPGGSDHIQSGFISRLFPGFVPQGDTLPVELTVSAYVPDRPVYHMDTYRSEEANTRIDEGYVIMVGNNYHAEEPYKYSNGAPHQHFTCHDLTLRFELDLTAIRTLRQPEIPVPVSNDSVTLSITSVSATPLQFSIEAEAAWVPGKAPGLAGKFILRDKADNTLKLKNLSDSPASMSESISRNGEDGVKITEWHCAIVSPNAQLPKEFDLVFRLTDGRELTLPIKRP